MTQTPNFRDIEKLSAYLDNQLSLAESRRLSNRLKSDIELQDILKELKHTRTLLKHTPKQTIPRNFTLTPKMVGLRPPQPRSVPLFRLASLTAAIMLFLSFAFNFLAPIASAPRLASVPPGSQAGGGCGFENPADCGGVAMEAPAYGIGGGAPDTSIPENVTTMEISPLVQDATTPEPSLEANMRPMEQPTVDSNFTPTENPLSITPLSEKIQTQPVLSSFQIGLIILILVLGSIALIIGQINIIRWRKRQ